jgi:hypothetical protein
MVYLDTHDVPSLCQIAAGEDGLHEELGQNKGTCSKYQLAIGGQEAVDRSDSWCLYFVLWCLLELVGEDRHQLHQLVPAVTGSCEDFRQAARKRGALMARGSAPEPGDIGLVVNTDANHAHHAFLVGRVWYKDGSRGTIEGNSNNTGGSNGDGVYERTKRWGINDPCTHGGLNHYELVRLTDPSLPSLPWVNE